MPNLSTDFLRGENRTSLLVNRLESVDPDSITFKVIHISAICTLGISIVVSIYTLVYLKWSTNGSFYKWKIGKYLNIYLMNFHIYLKCKFYTALCLRLFLSYVIFCLKIFGLMTIANKGKAKGHTHG